MEIILIGIATAFNVIVLKWKIDKKRYEDFALDILVLVALSWLFGGTMGGMVIAMIASAIVSLYLLVNPPNINKWLNDD